MKADRGRFNDAGGTWSNGREPKREHGKAHPNWQRDEDPDTRYRRFLPQKANAMKFNPEEEWLVDGVLPLQGVVMLFGESEAFKSFIGLHLSERVSVGETWAGRKTKKVPVLYIASEAPGSFAKRKLGIEKATGEPLPDTFQAITVAPNLGTQNGDLGDLIKAIEEVGVIPGIIVIDTMSMSLGGGEENTTGAQMFLQNARALSNHFRTCVIAVHHPGHTDARRLRGFSGLKNNTDVVILAERDGDNFATTLTAQKVKDGPSRFSVAVRLKPIPIATRKDGVEVTTLVVTSVEPIIGAGAATKAGAKAPKQKLPNSARLALRALHAAIGEVGEILATNHAPTGMRGVTTQQWRDFAFKTGISGSGNPHAMRTAFTRAFGVLQVAGKIGVWESYVWPVYEDKEKTNG